MATLMLKKFKKYWKSYRMILSLAIVLDPRYKLKFVKFIFSKIDHEIVEAKVNVVEDHLHFLFKEYYVPSTTISLSGETSNEMRDELEEFDTFDSHLGCCKNKTQLDLYLEEPNLDRKGRLEHTYYHGNL
ncbi:hypothetical protein KY290_003557 [Solanum tuberosum]|uniref:hAT-like transposase RNase-H fold domain-containing protein n=1 Tax=Solanum tuberosum TaxID=4113 RepID=A0ABQ7WVH6_SOLTU|nr:hypothetical protein KY284_003684 [Solanum tuberosum]KAH0732710.1 hypothetical protein KY289_003898 [Solanum tuberosum]KAH0767677.1 hypothetical protein KY285_003548 [Solanum tuberosum]KAH0783959.1 hypothetical protein KY290_003557 [Solanum tuberosum]